MGLIREVLNQNPKVQGINRNQQIYLLWEKGYTVDQISNDTAIPRSTVGYYVRKFNRYASKGTPIVLPPKSMQTQNLAQSAISKLYSFTQIVELLRAGDVEKAYYLLNIIKLINDLKIFPTKEEAEVIDKAFSISS